jgi:hypothetical protein
MAYVYKDKMDIVDLLYKGKLIGMEIQLEDDSWHVVEDAYCDYATFEINVKFTDITEALSFPFRQKHYIRFDDSSINYDNSKLKKKKFGRKKRK